MKQVNTPRTINFKGTITTIQPVAISTPDVNGILKDRHGNPYIAASSLRGAIRHSAVDAIQSIMAGEDKAYKVDVIYMLSQGVDTARQFERRTDGSVDVSGNQKYRDANKHMSLYGRWGLKGRLNVGNAYANSKDALVKVGGGGRSHAFDRNERLMSFVADDELDYIESILRADGVSSNQTKEVEKQVKSLTADLRAATSQDEKKLINQKIEALNAKIREIKDARVGASESIRRTIEQFEAIDANVELAHSFRLISPSEDEFHYFLWCLAMYSYFSVVGGHGNVGCGEIKGEWQISEFVQGATEPHHLGCVSIGSDGFKCDIPGLDIQAITDSIRTGQVDLSRFI